MTDQPQFIVCPRCEADAVRLDGSAPLSRATRDEGAEVYVCRRCGQREAIREAAIQAIVPISQWPLAIDELLNEERALIEQMRGGTIAYLPTDQLMGGDAA